MGFSLPSSRGPLDGVITDAIGTECPGSPENGLHFSSRRCLPHSHRDQQGLGVAHPDRPQAGELALPMPQGIWENSASHYSKPRPGFKGKGERVQSMWLSVETHDFQIQLKKKQL